MNFDVVIIGGGPAGLSAGLALVNLGATVAIIESSTYPREKTCAGILTQKTVTFLKEKIPLLNVEQFNSTNQLTLFYNSHQPVQFHVKNPFTFVDRKEFDFALVNICKDFNVHILENKKVSAIYPNQNTLNLNDGEIITYRYLIAADGVHSTVRKKMGLSEIPSGFCIQDSLERSLCSNTLTHLQELQLYFGHIPFGYSWIVPNNNCVIIGTGILIDKFHWPELQQKHNELCSKFFPPNIAKRRGAYVPIGGLIDQTAYPYENIIFIGDAAGFVNPLTGEGIYHALLSGFLVGDAYINEKAGFKTAYFNLIRDITNSLKEEYLLLSSFYSDHMLKNIFIQFKDYPEYLANACDEVVSLEHRSYPSIIAELNNLFR